MAKRSAKRSSRRKQQKQNQTLLIGLVAVVLVVLAGAIFFSNRAGDSVAGTLPREISVEEAYTKWQDGTFVLDVRTPEEWVAGHVPDATLIPLDELSARLSELPKDQEIVVICRSGNRSAQARDILLENGFEQVTSVGGGFNNWTANGYPSVVE